MTQEEQELERQLGIQVVAEKMTVVYEQTLQLRQKTKITEALAWLQKRLSGGRLTGQITTEYQSGGCRRVIIRHVGNVAVGSELQKAIEIAFDQKA